jgi:hypothetical protein
MDFLGFTLMLCVGNTAGWLVAIYVPGGDRLLLANVAIATLGAFAAGISVALIFPVTGGLGAGFGAVPGAALALLAAYRWRRPRRDS